MEEIKQHAWADHDVETEMAPGVVLRRRSILKFGIAGVATWLAGHSLGSGFGLTPKVLARDETATPTRPDRARMDTTFAEVVSQLHPQARQLLAAAKPDEAAYLAAVEKLIARVKLDTPWVLNDTGMGWSVEPTCWFPPIVIFRMIMEPGTVMNLHDHRHYNGVLLCTQGEVRCRNFEYVHPDGQGWNVAAGEVPPIGEDFLIRQTQDTLLKPQQLSSLTRDRDNLHTLVAGPEGCELVDFFTHFRPEARSYDLDWDPTPVDQNQPLFRASWKNDD
jgi:hypothetical protein